MSAKPENIAPADDTLPVETPVQMRVCPFCGVTRQPGSDRCDACTMDDTPLVRAATANKIGPWFVYQRRNPTAPGMKLAVLLNLIRAGHISGQTVVRGPTSQQLWGFAKDLQGISRALGECWSCHQPIAESDASCPRCKKTQDAPAEAELFVVNTDRKPVMREVPAPRVPSNPTPIAISEAAATAIVTKTPPAEPKRVPKALQREAGNDGDAILSFEELATAFKLSTGKPGWSGWRLLGSAIKTGLILLLISIATVTAAFFVQPAWRYAAADRARPFANRHAIKIPAWFNRTAMPAAATLPAPTNPKSYELTLGSRPEEPLTPKETPLTSITTLPATANNVPGPTTVVTPPEMANIVPIPEEADVPPATQQTPAITGAGNVPLTLAPELPQVDPALPAVEQGRLLKRFALEAESKRDFALAQRIYEQIKTLPSDAHPADLLLRLENAKRRAAAGR